MTFVFRCILKKKASYLFRKKQKFLSVVFHRVEVDKSIIHSLESAVIEWGHQIHRVLEKDSSEALEGRKPTPRAELLFWNNRSEPRHCSDRRHQFI